MYGQLTWDAKQGLSATLLGLMFNELKLPDAARQARLTSATTLVKQKIKGATPQESLPKQLPVLADVSKVVLRVPDDQFDFAMHMCLAHHLLPPEHFKFRTDKIQKIIDAHFAEFKEKPKELTDAIAVLKGLATLVPDLFLETRGNMFCALIRTRLIESSHLREYDDRRVLTKKIDIRMSKVADSAGGRAMASLLKVAVAEYLPAEFGSLRASLDGALDNPEILMNLVDVMGTMLTLSKDAPDLPREYVRALGPQMLKEALTNKARSADDWVAFGRCLVLELAMGFNLASRLVLWETVRAVESKIDMGKDTPKFQAALSQSRQAHAAVDLRMSKRLPKPQPGGSSGKTPSLTADDPVWSWSIDKLAQWIEGPVVEPAKTLIDRAKIVARAHDAHKQTLPLPAPTVVPNVTPGKPAPYKPTPAKPTPAKPSPRSSRWTTSMRSSGPPSRAASNTFSPRSPTCCPWRRHSGALSM